MTDKEKQYIGQIQQMSANAKAWRQRHPDLEAKIQFNYPREVMVIGGIDDAIREGYVSANNEGLQLIKALWPWGNDCPTPMMVQIALETE